MTVGDRIKVLRKKNGMTQEKLAEHLGVSYQAISKWETGVSNPDLALIVPITRLFNISADELFGIAEAAEDKERSRFNDALVKFRNSREYGSSYWWAKEAVLAYPCEYQYLEWLAFTEYRLALEESLSTAPNSEYFEESIGNSLRHYESIVENCTDTDIFVKAVLGKIMVLRFLDRITEADWSAEFEYPDVNIKTAAHALSLCEEGRYLLQYLENEIQ